MVIEIASAVILGRFYRRHLMLFRESATQCITNFPLKNLIISIENYFRDFRQNPIA